MTCVQTTAMTLTTEQLELLHRCVGTGPINRASIIFFGNEFGTAAGPTLERTLTIYESTWKQSMIPLGPGFMTLNVTSMPVSSIFLQYVSRLALAIKYEEPRFLEELSSQGKAFVNNFILNKLYRNDTAVINLRPLPRSTERIWPYTNYNEKEYLRLYNFNLKKRPSDSWSELRINTLRTTFDHAKDSLIIGVGDRDNKRAFFEYLWPDVKFEEKILTKGTKVWVSENPRIILSNYFSAFSGIGLKGLQDIYEIAK